MAKQAKASGNNDILYIFAYLLTWLSGILMYITVGQTDKRMKFHALQAIILGVVLFIIGWIPILGWIVEVIGWLYGLYVGYQAYQGTDVTMPVIGDFAKQYAK